MSERELLREFAQVSANLINAAVYAGSDCHRIPSMYLAALGSLANRAAVSLASVHEGTKR